jgi:tRNA 2-thiouridine synthesizing protein A
MILFDLFRPKMWDTTARRHGIYTNVGGNVDLPGHGLVQIYCRVACEGEGCPKPQLLTLKALNESPVGAVVEVVTDNLSVVETIPSMMDIYEGCHLGTIRGENNWRIYVRREPA